MSFRYLPCVLALAVLTTACSGAGDDIQVFGGGTDVINHRLTMHDGVITIKAPGVPNATVSPEGQLAIDGQNVAVNDAQHALLQRYNAAGKQMHDDAVATGKAGAETATKALGAVAGKMTGAESTEETRQKMDAAAEGVRQAAAKICDDLAEMKSVQDELASQLEAFKPYGQALTDRSVDKCRSSGKR
ncbi:DUF2884 family protein [Dyella japonica]|uniref:DUF2884 family protein n=1 Tax=Dyella japonica TaxID=231455 RepID=UPI0002E9C305|nr:DUF2884 family protein [Dyella japonica]